MTVMTRQSRLGFLLAGCVTMALGVVAADQPKTAADPLPSAEDGVEQRIAETCLATARRIEVRSPRGRCDLHPQPVLRWSKNTSEQVYGNVFVWTDRGLPTAVASIFRFVSPKDDLTAEFQSLSAEKVMAQVQSRTLWSAPAEGLAFRSVPEAAQPAVAPAARAAQMREIARRFLGEVVQDDNLIRLRMLTRGIFAYESPEQHVTAGAIFAFVEQTDPEILLLVQARGEGKSLQWEYAIARLNSWNVRMTLRDEEVWSEPALVDFSRTDSPYAIVQRLQDLAEFTELEQ